ncbi:MBL fold metallo-hydrolase [Emcibacter nanhaiensis]|uniref:MBL fold metallo-hydrolase n=1 Tax=Emcibacter nanhaiensis TaxID=1505037 RepID=A0A501P9F3_9PROT|nr:MBL fold metallo-hydrolase [Emcibacter nanhaiensis]TPD56858.1 MBL fold metallo-hydrolase [Emcibacter nanhaiensis]
MIRIADKWFERRVIGDGVTYLTEPHVVPFIRCNIWHVRGGDRDMLVDTGLGIVSLREAEKDLFEHPVTAVATHAHFDHMGGMHEFEDRVIHECEYEAMATAEDSIALGTHQIDAANLAHIREAGYELEDGSFLKALPHEGFRAECQKSIGTCAGRCVKEGDVIDLGNRVFEVLHLPGHSPGSIGLYERATEILFSGDAIYDGPLLAELPGSDMSVYVDTMKRLRELPVRIVHAGHEESFGRERLLEIVDRYLGKWDR